MDTAHGLLVALRHKANALLSERVFFSRRAKEEAVALQQATEKVACCEEACLAVTEVSCAVQRKAHERIAGVVTSCLKAVFGDSAPELVIVFERKRNQTEARLAFVREGVEYDPCESSGGGVIDVASFALRLSCMMLSKPSLRRLLVLDEPFRFVSKEYRPKVRELVEKLSEELNIQFILVTHDESFHIGKVIEVGRAYSNED